MRATLMLIALGLMAACSTEATYQDPAPSAAVRGTGGAYTGPCDRDDYPLGPAGDAEYTNCVIQN